MPTLDLTDEELQGFVHLCATASGPGVSWMLTNALILKAQAAAQAAGQGAQLPLTIEPKPTQPGNSEDHDAAVPRA